MPRSSEHKHINQAYAIIRDNDRRLERMGFFQPIFSSRHQDDIQHFTKYYDTKSIRLKSVDQAREFLFEFITAFLAPLNDNLDLRPYIKQYPLTWKNIDLYICCYDDARNKLAPPYIYIIDKFGDRVRYKQFDPITNKPVVVLEESMQQSYDTYSLDRSDPVSHSLSAAQHVVQRHVQLQA